MMKPIPAHSLACRLTALLQLGLLASCAGIHPDNARHVMERIDAEMRPAADVPSRNDAPPAAITNSLLPSARTAMSRFPGRAEVRFDLSVNDLSIGTVLSGIVADTEYSILLKPRETTGSIASNERVTLNLKNVTLFEALDSLREVYSYDYRVEGTRIYVQPPELQTRVFQLNYIVGMRRGVSDLQVIGGASVGSSSGGSNGSSGGGSGGNGGGNNSGGSYASVQASALSSTSHSDVWAEVEDVVRTSLGCQIPKITTQRSGGGGGGNSGSNSQSSSSGSASRADVSFQGDTQTGERSRGVDGCPEGRSMAVNQMSGTILARGMPRELILIERMLKSMQMSIDRQVIIEAKIIDVELNADSMQGINWSGFTRDLHRVSMGADTTLIGATTVNAANGSTSGGPITAGATLGQLLGAGTLGNNSIGSFANGQGLAIQSRSFSALIDFLQTQGQVHVLSSPRISTLNNQQAVIKVGSEEPYVTNIDGGTTTTTNGIFQSTPPTLKYQPFFSGISLDVTPQVDERGNITLHVHSLVNSITEKSKPSLPAAGAVAVPFAVNTVSEADSVVKSSDGQIVVIGGLMMESNRESRQKVPGAGDVPVAGALFRKDAQRSVKRELVILLKTTIVRDESAWLGDIASTRGRIQGMAP